MDDFFKALAVTAMCIAIIWGAIITISELVKWSVNHTDNLVTQCVASGKDFGTCYNVIKLRAVTNF